MKKIKLKLTILFFIISYLGLNAQMGITNLTINPTYPYTTSQIKVVANCAFGQSNCVFKGSTVSINNDTIKVISKHQIGLFMGGCFATDTVSIGQFPLGNYTLIFYLKDFQFNSTFDIDTLNFTINAPTGVPSNIKSNSLFNIYPNPTNDFLNIEVDILNVNNTKLQILNSLGQIVREEKIKDPKSQIDISHFPSGIYYLKIQSDTQTITHKIIKQ